MKLNRASRVLLDMRAWLFCLAACGATPAPRPVSAPPVKPAPVVHHLDDPDVNKHEEKLLSIDWSVDRDPIETWKLIAPTGADFEEKLQEIPEAQQTKLALALLGRTAIFLRLAHSTLFGISRGALLDLSPFTSLTRLALLRRRFLRDSLLLQVHQLLERKEN